jgi:glycosyltransferase involved in cell wall biosynthesis
LPTPPVSTGGLEYVVAGIAAAMHARGHEVTLFGLDGSAVTGVTAVTVPPLANPHRTETSIVDRMERLPKPDVLFDHSLYQLAQARWPGLPAVTQSHGWVKMPAHARNPVFCSRHHGQTHGIAEPEVALINVQPADFTLGGPMAGRGNPLFLGRIVPYKRVDLAALLCQRAGLTLNIAGPVSDPDYFARAVQPLFEQGISQSLGEVAGARKAQELANACCLMFTSEPEEPSGTVMLEAMASGTPVFAFDHGANREYVVKGVTGFLLDGEADFLAALQIRLWLNIDPVECRRHVEAVFSPERSFDRIELLLERAAKGERW